MLSYPLVIVFFFSSRRRHTRCLSDWSSDVCSSDLDARERPISSVDVDTLAIPGYDSLSVSQVVPRLAGLEPDELELVRTYELAGREIGRASCRERVEIRGRGGEFTK